MGRLFLFYRLMLRPLLQEPVRAMLTILAVTLGVAVVLAIDLAGAAATGSFHASMETLAGDNDLEVVASGGVPETVWVRSPRFLISFVFQRESKTPRSSETRSKPSRS